MRIALIDNYDSFTHSIASLLTSEGGEVQLYRCDRVSVGEIRSASPDLIVLGPGPGTPQKAGIMLSLVNKFFNTIPFFGICLGHQTLNEAFGGTTSSAQQPVHGKTSSIIHNKQGIFADLPSPTPMMRYHSLTVIPAPELEVTARTPEGEVMALRHPKLPIASVQFHPESILSVNGSQLIQNYFKQLQTTPFYEEPVR